MKAQPGPGIIIDELREKVERLEWSLRMLKRCVNHAYEVSEIMADIPIQLSYPQKSGEEICRKLVEEALVARGFMRPCAPADSLKLEDRMVGPWNPRVESMPLEPQIE